MRGPEQPRPEQEPDQSKSKPEHPLRSSPYRGASRAYERDLRQVYPGISEEEIKAKVERVAAIPWVIEKMKDLLVNARKIRRLENALRKEKAREKHMRRNQGK